MSIALTQTVFADDPPALPEPTLPDRADVLRNDPWISILAREVPPLKHELKDQMPMIMWHGVGYGPLSPSEIDVLRDRGLCQHLLVHPAMIRAAKALQNAKMPVILLEGRTDAWPYTLAKDPTSWAHRFDDDYQPAWFGKDDAFEWHGACPHLTAGWQQLAKQTRVTMQRFKDAGVTVDAVLVDYEGDPYPWTHTFEQIGHCRRCRAELPPEVVRSKEVWRDYAWKKYVSLYDEHFAKPILDVFPNCLVSNWHVVFSGQVEPVRYFVRDVKLPTLRPRHFTATNPIAYASDMVWQQLGHQVGESTGTSVDAFYAEQMLQQVESDRRNRRAAGAHQIRAIPWIGRVVKIADNPDQPAPMMSRESYRATLAEIWDEDVLTMQIFNPMHDGFEELALQEVQDAVAAMDEMLERAK